MTFFSHPNIIAYKEAFFDDATSTFCMVMEYAAGGDLTAKIAAHIKDRTIIEEPEIWNMFVQMVTGLKTLHDLKILHRDLKVTSAHNGRAQTCSCRKKGR